MKRHLAFSLAGLFMSGGMLFAQSSIDQLLAMKDRLPLSGIQPSVLPSRRSIDKALPRQPKHNITIAFCGETLGSTFFTEMVKSAREAAAKYGYKFNYQNANSDFQQQLSQIETFISQRPDVLFVNSMDVDASVKYFERAVQAGIPVVTCGPSPAKTGYPIVTNVLSGSFEPGYMAGVYTAQKLYQKGKLLKAGFVCPDMSYADSQSRPCGFISGYLFESHKMMGKPYASKWDAALDGYKAWIKFRDEGKNDNIGGVLDFVGYGVGGTMDPSGGQKASSDLLTAHPDMDVVMCMTDTMVRGVIQEMKQHNIVPGKQMKVIAASDGTKEAMDYIKSGEMFCTGFNSPYPYGGALIELIHKIFEEKYDASNMPVNSFTPVGIITKENVANYYNPDGVYGKPQPWKMVTIDEYNASSAK